MIRVQPEEFKVIAAYIYSICGITLDTTKTYLIDNRLGGLVQEAGCGSFSEFYFKAKSDPTGTLQRRIIDAITTGETLFFRDIAPFELLQHKILPDLIDRRMKSSGGKLPINLRIWSAAASTGQEIYSIGIVLKELLIDLTRYNISILGTDISDKAIATASRGIYGKVEIERGLPQDKLQRYFSLDQNTWKIRDEIRALATFRRLNLLEDFSSLGKWDIIFCRNVAIYFSEQDKTSLFNRIGKALAPDGYLVLGSTESIATLCPQFQSNRYLRSVFYQLKG